MAEALKVVPSSTQVNTGVKNAEAVAEGLAQSLADTYRLVFKTHAYHWNVEGPLFYAVHKLTEEQYADMFAAADVLAERIRALGVLAPMHLAVLEKDTAIADKRGKLSAGAMIEDLVTDHEKVSARLRDLSELAETHKDIVTHDLCSARSAFHEKAAWMLRSLIAE